jgi:hypothetical protein
LTLSIVSADEEIKERGLMNDIVCVLCGRKCVLWKIWWGRRGDKALENFI